MIITEESLLDFGERYWNSRNKENILTDYQPIYSFLGEILIQHNDRIDGKYQEYGNTFILYVDGEGENDRFGYLRACRGFWQDTNDILRFCGSAMDISGMADSIYSDIVWFEDKDKLIEHLTTDKSYWGWCNQCNPQTYFQFVSSCVNFLTPIDMRDIMKSGEEIQTDFGKTIFRKMI